MKFENWLDQDEADEVMQNAERKGLSRQNVELGLDAIQLGLDAWGLEQFTGWIGDLINTGISTGRAVHGAFTGGKTKDHATNALISLVSVLPFGDIAKILKVKKGPQVAKGFIKAARGAKDVAKAQKMQRMGRQS
jgi:hypothetical protein